MKIAEWLTIIGMLVSTVVYAENYYAKQQDVVSQFRNAQIEQYQIRVDVLKNTKMHRGLTPEQEWELGYFKDKRDNLLKKGVK